MTKVVQVSERELESLLVGDLSDDEVLATKPANPGNPASPGKPRIAAAIRVRTRTAEGSTFSRHPHPHPLRAYAAFFRENYVALLCLAFGLTSCTVLFGFTRWLGGQNVHCPDWARNCTVAPWVAWMRAHASLVQGLVTAASAVGLSALAVFGRTPAEAAVWPLAAAGAFDDVDQVDAYLAAARSGSSLAARSAFAACWRGRGDVARVLAATALLTVTPYMNTLVVMWVYLARPMRVPYESAYQLAGGIGRVYAPSNPLTAAAMDSGTLSWFVAWTKGAAEPLPEYRDWYVDRAVLASRGDMTVNAVRIVKEVSCRPFAVTQLLGPDLKEEEEWQQQQQQQQPQQQQQDLHFATNMAAHNGPYRYGNSSDHVEIRPFPYMAVFAYDFVFRHANRTSATLVFAAVNGHIDGGQLVELLPPARGGMANVTSVACDIDITLTDDVLVIGHGTHTTGIDTHTAGVAPPRPSQTLSTVADVHIGHENSTTDASRNTRNEVALWFAVAPVLCGVSVDGKSPMFYNNHEPAARGLPVPFTSTNNDYGNSWTRAEILHFVDVAVGAFGLATSPNWSAGRPVVRLRSVAGVSKTDPAYAVPLLLLPGLALLLAAYLLFRNWRLHRVYGPARMRRAPLARVVRGFEKLR